MPNSLRRKRGVRIARALICTSLVWRMASMADIREARRAGSQAEIRMVTKATTAAAIIAAG